MSQAKSEHSPGFHGMGWASEMEAVYRWGDWRKVSGEKAGWGECRGISAGLGTLKSYGMKKNLEFRGAGGHQS